MSQTDIQCTLNRWDADLGRAMQTSEQKLRQPSKKYAWSPTLRNAAIIRRYWKLRMRELTSNANYYQTFRRWQTKLQAVDPEFFLPDLEDTLSLEDIRAQLNNVTRVFRRVQHNSTDIRQRTYEQLLLKYQDEPSTESTRKAGIVQRTIDSETCRALFRNIRDVIKPSPYSSLWTIEIPRSGESEDTAHNDNLHEVIANNREEEIRWETVVDRASVEKHLLQYNQEAFRAAAKSPCGHGTIYNAITFTSHSTEAKQVLEGMVPSSWYGDDKALGEFLTSFRIRPSVLEAGNIHTDIHESDVKEGFSRWTENTTTSPSGRHLGHYRAMVQDPQRLRCLTLFLNITLSNGLTIPRWNNAVNVMIEKDPGRPKINRLRIIHLFEADFNFILKLTWGKRLVRRAIDLDLLHDGQHGSTPGRTTMDPIMLTMLTTDVSRVNKTNLLRFDNDASACYDRIIVALGMLAAGRCGMPENAIRTHAKALEWMKYKVKTLDGISENNYSGTEFETLFGTGQGSGASPAVWLTLVVILLHTLDRLIPERMSFSSPNGAIHHLRLVDAYVDDTSLGFTDDQEEQYSYDALIHRLQHLAQTWSHLLELSGGTQNFKKCSWYIMFWEWDKGRPTLKKKQSNDTSVALTSTLLPDAPPTMIVHKELNEEQRLLGVYLTPLGDFSAQLRHYRKTANNFALRLHSPRIKPSDVTVFHRSVYVPTMRYGLAATVAGPKELQLLPSLVLASMLQKMGVSSKIPTAIRHGPAALGGLELYDLRTEIGIEQIKFIRDSVYSNTAAGKLLMISLHSSQQEAGVEYPRILEEPSKSIPYLTPTWLTSVRSFMSDHNLQITISHQPVLSLQSNTDTFIMQCEHLKRYTVQQQRDINLVRIYLQAITLADLTDARRPEAISLAALDGMRNEDYVPTSEWPRQKKPSTYQRRLWKRYIKSSFLRYVPMWKQPPLSIPEARTFEHNSQVPQPVRAQSELPTKFPTLKAYIRSLSSTQRRMVDGVKQKATDLQIWRAFRSKERIVIASDGGLEGKFGTFGWVIATKKHTLYEGSGPVDGPFDTSSSTRSELCGFESALLFVAAINRYWGLKHRCVFKWITDSKGALSRVIRMIKPGAIIRSLPSDSDLLTMIRSLLFEIRRSVTMQWIKGHQDKLMAYKGLSREAKLNMSADLLATRYRKRGTLQSRSRIDHPDAQRISILMNGTRLTSQFDACIRYHVNGYHLRRHIQSKRKWNDSTWDSIDHDLFGKHFTRLESHRQIFQMKFSHDQLPLGQVLLHRSPVHDPTVGLCPCCRAQRENVSHLLRCLSNQSIPEEEKAFLKDPHFPDAHPLRRTLMEGFHQWRCAPDIPFTPDVSQYPPEIQSSIRQAISSQNRIGWEYVIKGYLSNRWTDLASRTLDKPDSVDVPRGRQRMRKVIDSLHTFARSIWKFRNAALHETEITAGTTTRSAVDAEIRHFYAQPTLLHFDERYLCDRDLDTLLKSSTSNKTRWLRRARISQRQQANSCKRQTLLTRFYPPTTDP